MKCLYTAPKIVKKMFPKFIWSASNNRILFTFDDGPNPDTTEIILKELSTKNTKAVFFCVGENILKHGKLADEILAEGHLIGNHTYSHNKVWGLSKTELTDNLLKFNSLIENKYSRKVEYFRPPHGQFDFTLPSVLNNLKMKNVMWSLLTRDYRNDFNIVKLSVEKYLQSSSIIVLHDSLKSKKVIIDSIKFIFETAESKGFEIGVPAECLK